MKIVLILTGFGILEGKNFKQISPAGYDLRSWKLITSSSKVLMTLTEINIDKDTTAKEIFGTGFKNKLKILYDRDWKKITE